MTWQYDQNGNPTQKTDARGIVTTMTYGPLDNILTKVYSDGTPNVSFGYDEAYREISVVTSAAARVIEGYDALDRPLGAAQSVGQNGVATSVSHAWQPAGLQSTTLPSGRVVTYAYDNAGRMQSATGVLNGASTRRTTGSRRALGPVQLRCA